MGQMTVEQWYGTIKTGLTKKLTENKEALPAGFNQQRFTCCPRNGTMQTERTLMI